jgi:hypothetical protein
VKIVKSLDKMFHAEMLPAELCSWMAWFCFPQNSQKIAEGLRGGFISRRIRRITQKYSVVAFFAQRTHSRSVLFPAELGELVGQNQTSNHKEHGADTKYTEVTR